MTMIQQPEITVTRNPTFSPSAAGATPRDALTSSPRSDRAHWKQAIDEMLKWKSCSDCFDAGDQPDQAILETAIDYAHEQTEQTGPTPAPATIIPSGSGRIAMEWNDGPLTVIIEFIALGQATYTRFNQSKIELKAYLVRNPRSRKLELRG